MRKDAIIIILQIDCEPDLHYPERGRPANWEGFVRLFALTQEWRRTLNQKSPQAKLNWFWRVDQQIEDCHGRADWAFGEFTKEIEVTQRLGDLHGLHPHAWRWADELAAWMVDQGNWPFVERLTRQAIALYRKSFGEPCQAFRFGSEWFSPALWELERSLGIIYEMTLVVDQPGVPSLDPLVPSSGSIPDRQGYPLLPFRQQGLWIIPNSSGALNLPLGGYGRRGKLYRWRHGLGPAKAPRDETQVVANLGFAPDSFHVILENALMKADQKFAVLVIRSDAAIDPKQIGNLKANLKLLRDHPWAGRFHFTTPAGAIEALGMI